MCVMSTESLGFSPSAFAAWENANIAAMNAQASTNQLFCGDGKPDHKRMTRRKWWLVRKAIPLPWVKR